jgi:hypothetical protein
MAVELGRSINDRLDQLRPRRSVLAVATASLLILGSVYAITLAPSTAASPVTPHDAISDTYPAAAIVRLVTPSPPKPTATTARIAPSAPSARTVAPAKRTTAHLRTGAAVSSSSSSGYGCGPALAYLRSHAAPGFRFQCPGNAWGHQAMTCANHAPQCPGSRIIAIAVPCRASYMNEASNSWVMLGLRHTAIDPYGYCH